MGKRFSMLLTLLLVANLLIPPSMISFAETEEESLPQLKFDFEDGTTQGWGGRGGVEVLTPTADAAYSGDYGLHVSGRTSGWHGPTYNLTSFMEQEKTYIVSGWIRLPEGIEQSEVSIKVERVTDGNANYETVGSINVSDSEWVEFTGEYTLNNPVERIALYLEAYANPELEFYVDDILIEEKEVEEIPEEEFPEGAIVVDGFNITDAVTGPSLKDEFKDYFKFGVGLNGSSPSNDTVQSAAMSEIIKHQFNSVTYTNLMKPSYLLNQQESIANYENGNENPAVNYDSVIAGLEFAKENGIQMRGHVLVWHAQTPDWFFREGYKSDGEFVDRETMLHRLENYIKQVLEFMQTEYPGVIYSWDVVNEAVEIVEGHYETETGFHIRTKYGNDEDNLWYKTIGTDYIEKSFQYARKYADEDVKLFYNDYNTFQPKKTDSIYGLVASLKEKGLIDGIGMQSYMGLSYPAITSGYDNVKAALEKFGELGLELHLTELTISSDDKDEASMQRQADRYKELFEVLMSLHVKNGGPANITSVTVFGVMDEYLFYTDDKQYSRLFDGKLQPKPAFYSILSVLKMIRETSTNFGSPNIDGKKDVVWETVPATPFSVADMPVSFKTLWDDENLYVWTKVKDSTVNKNDLVEIFLHDENGIQHYKINRKGKNQSHYKVKEGKDGYVAEIKIPSAQLAIGQEIRFDIRVTDVNENRIVSWNDKKNNQEDNHESFGKLNLKDAINTATAVFGTPILDGEKDKVWDKAVSIRTEKVIEGTNGAWANVRTLWDKEHLYIYAEVHDQTLTNASANVWEQDSIEIFVDQNNGKTAGYESDDGQYRVNFNNEQSYGGAASSDNFTTFTRLTDDGYVVEAAIKLNFAAKKGIAVGFDVQVNDDQNDDGSRDSVSIWEDATGQSYQNTSRLGVLVLTNGNGYNR
ncbi:endo-1,4-beta-xylanase [Lederbergia graminis]|uniref:Beta-xylanase n=1 Tax=Lederbergia graminis TaxID=735518 RepID=A0ABW0LGP5_9BACI